jgi:hypothetical protein
MDDAINRLDPKRVAWLETKVWQRILLPAGSYEVRGHYLAAPDHRLRLDLTTIEGETTATLHVVSDGQAIWQARRVGDEGWNDVQRAPLNALASGQSNEAPMQWLRQLPTRGFTAILEELRHRVHWMRQETIRRGGKTYLRLTGMWSDGPSRESRSSGEPDLRGQPRQCRIYLKTGTLWPHRVEWWGPSTSHGGDSLLLEMEFRDPVLNRPLSAERCFEEFAFAPPR